MKNEKKGGDTTPPPVIPGTEFDINSAKQRNEDTYFLAQEKRVFRAFWGPPKTMLEVEAITGVMRSNICYFIGDWLKTKSIKLIEEGVCSVSKHKAGRYSANPIYWIKGGKNGC